MDSLCRDFLHPLVMGPTNMAQNDRSPKGRASCTIGPVVSDILVLFC